MSKKITDLASLSPLDSDTDLTVVVDVDDATMAASGTDKKATLGDLRTLILNTAASLAANAKINSLGVGQAASGTAGRVDLGQVLTFNQAGAQISFSGNNNSIAAQGASASITLLNGNSGIQLNGNIQFQLSALTHGTTVAVNATFGTYFTLNVTSNIADVIQPPTNPPASNLSQRLTFEIRNTSGGALGTQPAFSSAAGGYRVSGLPALANNQFYTVSFWYNSATLLWMQDGTASPAQAV